MHKAASIAWLLAFAVGTGFAGGYWLGVQHSPSFLDAIVMEKRLREVFCEQALRHGLLRQCRTMGEM
jgi:hypothetical protein